MWIGLIVVLFILAGFAIWQTPRNWWKNKIARIFVIIFHAIGIASFIFLLWFYHFTQSTTVKDIALYIETIYFSFTIFLAIFSIVRYALAYIFSQKKDSKVFKFVSSGNKFFALVAILTILFLIPGIYNANTLVKKTYSIASEKINQMKIAFVADLHVGAGATPKIIDEMVKIVNDMDADVLLIGGDISDSASTEDDLEYLSNSLSKIKTKYGIYYCEGNHEKEGYYDVVPYMEKANAIYLYNETYVLPNGVVLVGMSDKRDKSLPEIKKDVSSDAPCIVIQHRSVGYKKLSKDADLVVSGHTHGYQFPFIALGAPFVRDFSYGIKNINGMIAIDTSGVGTWGYKVTWPSKKEVVEIDIN